MEDTMQEPENVAWLPWQREPMQAANDPEVRVVVLAWPAQSGKTETLLGIGRSHRRRGNAPLMVLPTDAQARVLAERGTGLDIVGADRPSALVGGWRRVVLLDEVDQFTDAGEGDPSHLVLQRALAVAGTLVVMASSPTNAAAGSIESWLAMTSFADRVVACASCGIEQTLDWYDSEADGCRLRVAWQPGRPETARYHCLHCGAPHDDAMLRSAQAAGGWRHRYDAAARPWRGYRMTALGLPWVTLADLAAEWERAGTPERMAAFHRLRLARAYRVPAAGGAM